MSPPGTFHGSPCARSGLRTQTRQPRGPTPPRSATDTPRPSSRSATTRTPARRPSSHTPPDADPSADESRGPSTTRHEQVHVEVAIGRGAARSRFRSKALCSRPRRLPWPTRTHDTRPPSPRTGPRQTAARQHHQRRALRAVAEDLTRTPRIRPPPQARKRRRERDTTTELPSSRSSPLTGRRAWIAPALARRRSPAPDRVNYNLGNHGYSGASPSDLTLSDRSFQPHRGVFAEPPTQERGQGRRNAASDPGRPGPATCTTMYCRPSWR